MLRAAISATAPVPGHRSVNQHNRRQNNRPLTFPLLQHMLKLPEVLVSSFHMIAPHLLHVLVRGPISWMGQVLGVTGVS